MNLLIYLYSYIESPKNQEITKSSIPPKIQHIPSIPSIVYTIPSSPVSLFELLAIFTNKNVSTIIRGYIVDNYLINLLWLTKEDEIYYMWQLTDQHIDNIIELFSRKKWLMESDKRDALLQQKLLRYRF